MKNIISVIIILLSIKGFSQTYNGIIFNVEDELNHLNFYNNLQTNNFNNIYYNLSSSEKKTSIFINDYLYKCPNARDINNYNKDRYDSFMFYWAIPIIAGILFADSYDSFKNGYKKEGYIELGIGTSLLVGTTILIFYKRNKSYEKKY